jgi:hypothetical protein
MDFYESATELFLPVMESGTLLAAHYAKACGRDTVTAEDLQYGLMYAARNVAGKQTTSLFPEIYDSSDSDEEDVEVVEDDETPFTRYTGEEKLYCDMNECADTWGQWVPDNPLECALKRAIDKAGE